MRRAFFAIGTIVLLVFTLFSAFAVTAQQTVYEIAPGHTSTWTGSSYNVADTKVVIEGAGITFDQTVKGATLATKDSVGDVFATSGQNVAYVGVQWSLKPGVSWEAVKRQPVVVSAIVSYKLSGNGIDKSTSTVAIRGGDPITSVNLKTIAQAGTHKLGVPYSVTAQQRVMWLTTLQKLSTDKGQGMVTVGLWTTIANSGAVGENLASGDVTVSAITLTLL